MSVRALLLSAGLAALAGCSAAPLRGPAPYLPEAPQAAWPAQDTAPTSGAPAGAEPPPNTVAVRTAFDAAGGLVWGHSIGVELHRALGQHLGFEASLQSVTLVDIFDAFFEEDEQDVDMVELDLGARYTWDGMELGSRRLRPFGSLGLALVDVDGATSDGPVLETVDDGTDLGFYARAGVQLEANEGFLVGLDVKGLFGTDDVNAVSIGLSVGWSF